MRFIARVEVRLRPGIADPEGATMGFTSVASVSAGRSFRVELDADNLDGARAMATQLADRLLANPVIEESVIEVSPL